MKIFIDGYPDLGKTTLLIGLKRNGLPAFPGDYHEFCMEFASSAVSRDQFLASAYSFYEMMSKMEEGIYDRLPCSGMIYSLVLQELSGTPVSEAQMDMVVRLLDLYLRNEECHIVVLYCHPCSEPELLKVMEQRQNGLDVLSLDYIKAQRVVFNALVERFPSILTYEVDVEEGRSWLGGVEILIESLWYQKAIMCRAERKQLFNDGGVDLTPVEWQEVPHNSTAKVLMRERFFIPPGMCGTIHPRSSCPVQIACGVIDATYTGDISVRIFTQNEGFTVTPGRSFCQLVIHPVAQRGTASLLPLTGRKAHGFGSTDVMNL